MLGAGTISSENGFLLNRCYKSWPTLGLQAGLSWSSLTSTTSCLVGESSGVATALDRLKIRCADIGLKLSTGIADGDGRVLSKDTWELILTSGEASSVDAPAFPSDFKVVRDGSFELLRGPVGTPQFCNQHT